jgi:antitoxin component YwqK of YwqJK toxin-antitoxin module
MRLSIGIVLAAGLVASSAVAAGAPEIVAVFDIEVSGVVLKPAAVDGLGDYLFGKIAAVPGLKAVPRAEVKRRLREEAKESYSACYDESCQIEIGRELAAQKTISTKIVKLGDECNVSVVLYDLRTSATEHAADVTGACTAGALARSLENAVVALARARSTPQGAAVMPVLGEVDPEHCPLEGTRRMGDPPPKGQSVYCVDAANKMHGAMKSWHPTGKLAMTAEYRDGQLEGRQAIFHRTGQVFQEGENRAGKKQKLWVSYFDDGKKQEEGNYSDGAKTGVWITYDPQGNKRNETEYRQDLRHGRYVAYHPSGEVEERGQYEDDKQTGVWVDLRKDGTKDDEASWRAGKLHGPRIDYDSKGRKETVTTYVDGRRSGPHERWRYAKDGTPRLEAKWHYRDDEQDGDEVRYDDEGEPRTSSVWSKGKKSGPSTSWSRSQGQRYKSEEGTYEAGEKHGRWRRFDPSGQVTSEDTWARGKKHGPSTTWSKDRAGTWYKSREGHHENDEREGRWQTYRPDGTIEREETYREGRAEK